MEIREEVRKVGCGWCEIAMRFKTVPSVRDITVQDLQSMVATKIVCKRESPLIGIF